MKRFDRFRLTLASLLAVSTVTPLTAYDGVDPETASELSRPETLIDGASDGQGIFIGDALDNDVQKVSHSSLEECGFCEITGSSDNCGSAGEDRSIFDLTKNICGASDCVAPWWSHRTGFFGEFMLLRPGSTDLIYATEQTDPDPNIASPTGPIGIVELDAESGFRAGFTLAASECTSLVASYARWEGSASSTLTATGSNVLDSNLIHPSTATSGAASLESFTEQEINFQTVDILYRRLWKRSNTMALNWLAGVRYGDIEQQLSGDQTVSVATGLTNVSTDIDFSGFGIAGGLDFETFSCTTGLSLYGRTLASLLAGEWNANYTQTNQFGGGVVANQYEDFHATPVLDAELGIRWMAKKRRFMMSAGFLMSGWYESVTTRSYINSVRAGQLTDTGETMTFSGLTAGAEWRF
ncbi:MAG: Lpg1974 family pore-forming outer membrane protein [Planctomycetota bacterium]